MPHPLHLEEVDQECQSVTPRMNVIVDPTRPPARGTVIGPADHEYPHCSVGLQGLGHIGYDFGRAADDRCLASRGLVGRCGVVRPFEVFAIGHGNAAGSQ